MQVSLELGKGVNRPFLPALGGGKPRLTEELGGNDEILKVMREIEADVLRCTEMAVAGHPRIAHLEPELSHASNVLKGKPGAEDIVKVAEAFLVACDTLPTYDPADARGYVRVLERRRVAAAVVDRSEIRWFGMAMLWSRSH